VQCVAVCCSVLPAEPRIEGCRALVALHTEIDLIHTSHHLFSKTACTERKRFLWLDISELTHMCLCNSMCRCMCMCLCICVCGGVCVPFCCPPRHHPAFQDWCVCMWTHLCTNLHARAYACVLLMLLLASPRIALRFETDVRIWRQLYVFILHSCMYTCTCMCDV